MRSTHADRYCTSRIGEAIATDTDSDNNTNTLINDFGGNLQLSLAFRFEPLLARAVWVAELAVGVLDLTPCGAKGDVEAGAEEVCNEELSSQLRTVHRRDKLTYHDNTNEEKSSKDSDEQPEVSVCRLGFSSSQSFFLSGFTGCPSLLLRDGVFNLLRWEDGFDELVNLAARNADLEEVGVLGPVLLPDCLDVRFEDFTHYL